jgi:hypothetical protein
MAKFEQKTIRDSLLGMVADHMLQGKIVCGITHQVGCEFVASLAAYREEGLRLYPEVYLLGPSSDDLLNLLSPGSPQIRLGAVPIEGSTTAVSRATAATSLKTCASLAIDGWAIFVRRETSSFEYGLFRPAAAPYSASAEETLTASDVPAVLFRNCAEHTVEIINSVGERLEISLTTATPSISSASGQIVTFSRVVCADLEEVAREQVVGYVSRILTESLRSSHGALLAVAPVGEVQLPEAFSDGVILAQPIPLARAALSAIRDQSGGAVSLLRSYEALLRGMIASDGVTILSTDGSIRAFRVFLHSPANRPTPQPAQTAGGARTRAFELLRGYVGSPLRAALFRSEDGRMEVVVTT